MAINGGEFTQDFRTQLRKYSDGTSRIGEEGRLWYNNSDQTLRVSDGETEGGIVLNSGGGGGGSSGITVKEEGSSLSTKGTVLNFVGTGITATGTGATKTITVDASAITVQDEGSALSTAATALNFVGSGVTASGTGATKTITISGGSGEANQNAFSNVAVSGQSTVAADAATDTLNLAAGSNVTITTTAGTDTVTIASTDTNTEYSVGDGGLTQNNFTNTLKTKLDGIEASATADQTAAEIRTLVESATDSNVFTDADHSKLNAIEASADVTDTANVVAALTAGTNITIASDGTIASSGGGGGGGGDVADDTSPQLGGDLDIAGFNITSAVSNQNINIVPNGTGKLVLDGDFLPATNVTYDLGSSSFRWKDLFLSGNTIDLAGSTISSDGTGQISISANGVTLPDASKTESQRELATLSANNSTNQVVVVTPFFSSAGGLVTKNTDFEFNATVDNQPVFTGTATFTLANGSSFAESSIVLFQL